MSTGNKAIDDVARTGQKAIDVSVEAGQKAGDDTVKTAQIALNNIVVAAKKALNDAAKTGRKAVGDTARTYVKAASDFDGYGVTVTKQILSRELRALGYLKLSARPRLHEKGEAAAAAFIKTSPRSWRTSRRRPAAS